jgi:D-sedoheptulose 7-phosphate isomerase
MTDAIAKLRSYADEHEAAIRTLRDELLGQIEQIAQVVIGCFAEGGQLLSCGNGGSAADAMHLAEELIGRYHQERRPLPAIALTADSTALTCIANDYGYENVFARQVTALAHRGDVMVGITTSGNSANILNALAAARQNGATTILLTGGSGGRAVAERSADHALIVPADTPARIQEMHIFVIHCLCQRVDDWLLGEV